MQAALVQQWLGLDAGLKQQIKQQLLGTLGAQVRGVWQPAALVQGSATAAVHRNNWLRTVCCAAASRDRGVGGARLCSSAALGRARGSVKFHCTDVSPATGRYPCPIPLHTPACA